MNPQTTLKTEQESALIAIVAISGTKDPEEIKRESLDSVLSTFSKRIGQMNLEVLRAAVEGMRNKNRMCKNNHNNIAQCIMQNCAIDDNDGGYDCALDDVLKLLTKED